MKGALVFFSTLFVIASAAFAENETTRTYLVPKSNFEFLKSEIKTKSSVRLPQIIESNADLHLVKMNAAQVDALTAAIHKNKMSCGGFMDVEDRVQSLKSGEKINLKALTAQDLYAQFRTRSETLTPKYPTQARTLVTAVNRSRFENTLKDLSAMNDRYSRAKSGQQAAEWLAQQAQDWANKFNRSDVKISQIATGGSYIQPSIVVHVPGQNSSLPSVVLGGHMDTFQNNKPGSDDDGSGTTAVFEIYRTLIESQMRLQRDTDFIFYAAEEMGLVGSQKVVSDFTNKKRAVRGVLQFDMIGFKSPNDHQKVYFTMDYTDATLTAFTKVLAKQYVGLSDSDIGEIMCDYACSDHASWNRRGYATVFPFEASFENYNQTIHTGQDAMNLIDIDHAMTFVKLGAAFAVEMGEPVSAKR